MPVEVRDVPPIAKSVMDGAQTENMGEQKENAPPGGGEGPNQELRGDGLRKQFAACEVVHTSIVRFGALIICKALSEWNL